MSAFSIGTGYIDFMVNDSKLAQGLNRVQATVGRLQGRMNMVGQYASMAMTQGIAAGGGAFNQYAKYETQMAKIQTLFGKNTAFADKYRVGIRALSLEFGEGTEEIANGLYDIISAGIPADQALTVLRESMKSAVAGFTDTRTAVQGITSVLMAYGVSAKDVVQINDQLFQAVRMGKLEFKDLATNVGKVAPLAFQSGASLADMLAMYSVLTNAGNSAETSAVQLSAFFKAFIKPSAQTIKAAKAVEFRLGAAAVEGDNLYKAIKSLAGLSAEEITGIFPDIRGTRAALAFKTNILKVGEAMESMKKNSPGAADEAFGIMSKTPEFQMKRLKQAMIELATTIGQTLAPVVAEIVGMVMEALPAMKKFVQEHEKGIQTFVKFAAATILVAGVLPHLTRIILMSVFGVRSLITVLAIAAKAIVFTFTNPIWAAAIATVALFGAVVIRYTVANESWAESCYHMVRAIGLFNNATQNMAQLMAELGQSSNAVSAAQRDFNETLTGDDLAKQEKALNKLVQAEQNRLETMNALKKAQDSQVVQTKGKIEENFDKAADLLKWVVPVLAITKQIKEGMQAGAESVATVIDQKEIDAQVERVKKLEQALEDLNKKRMDDALKPYKDFIKVPDEDDGHEVKVDIKPNFQGVSDLWKKMQLDLFGTEDPLKGNTNALNGNKKAVEMNTAAMQQVTELWKRGQMGLIGK